jgi:GTP-binding protein
MKFIDEVNITLISGSGGAGSVSFRREAMVPRGGPDGGDGGKGGDVIFEVDPRLHSLLDFKFQRTYKADDGDKGASMNRSGKTGADLVLKVPPGTMVKDANGEVLHDLADGDRLVFLSGGMGGKGNVFYKSSVNQAPTIAQKGIPGQEKLVHLELKLLADVGIIGLPNAGKSTLISRISSAKPKIADYPFTTLVPNLGVVRFAEELSFVVADIPGLIEGASHGAGLGIQFLRHIERTRVFVHMIDVGPMTGKSPWEAYREIRGELEAYDKSKREEDAFVPLSTRPEIVVFNKLDTVDRQTLREFQAAFEDKGLETMTVSAATGENIRELVQILGKRVFDDKE